MPGHVGPAKVIGNYEDDIWLGRDGGEQGGGEDGQQEEDHVRLREKSWNKFGGQVKMVAVIHSW